MSIELFKFDYIFALSVLLAAGGLVLLWHLQNRKAVFLWRAANIVVLLLLICQPVLVNYSSDDRPLVAVAVDVSPSMVTAGRIKTVEDILERNYESLSEKLRLKNYVFSSLSGQLNTGLDKYLKDKKSAESLGFYTDLYRSLWDIRRENGEKLSGIILLSDGNHNAGTLPESWIKELNIPVFPVNLGNKGGLKDLAINGLKVSDFAFKNLPLKITVNLSAIGFSGRYATVNLRRIDSNATLASHTAKINSDNESFDAVLDYTPSLSGRFMYEAEALPLKGETTLANNKKRFYLDIIRDKIRVLYLCGQPGPEYSFLRHYLKNDPLVELVSFVILRNPENITLVSDYDLSLIPFPVETIFVSDLKNFDVFILDNFTYRRFGFLPEYLANIKRWVVEKGGGLIMIGGENSFGKGGWAGTPLESILPVIFDKPQDEDENGLFSPKIEDTRQDIMRLNDDEKKNLELWKNAPQLEGCQALVKNLNAKVLLRHPWKNWVVLASWDIGKGRAAALGANTTWRWALAGQSTELYYSFWKNMIRYLSHSEKSFEGKINLDRPEYFSGQEYSLKLRGNKDLNRKNMKLVLVEPSGQRSELEVNKISEKEWEAKGVFRASGKYSFQFYLNENGVFAAKDSAGVDVKPFLLQEKTNLKQNDELLNSAAAESGGEYFDKDEILVNKLYSKLRDIKKRAVINKTTLWSNPWLMALIILSFLGEWIYRRKIGLW
ncbi:MAG: glutamine amidotransferase [Elusimicrobia bacterium]|nr:glutamine amidotransferase [Candidatus Liberimonas magnetica]